MENKMFSNFFLSFISFKIHNGALADISVSFRSDGDRVTVARAAS